jgi:hypothetical protein
MHVTRGQQRSSSRKIRRSILSIVGTEISHPPIIKKEGPSVVLLVLKSGVRSIAQLDTIWRSVELIRIARRKKTNQKHQSHVTKPPRGGVHQPGSA